MKKKIIISVFVTVLLSSALVFALFALVLRPKPLNVTDVDLASVEDGKYVGICQNKILFAVVEVEVTDHEISNIEVLEHKKTYLKQANKIADFIVEEQSLEVDAITGATLTSDTVKKAIEDALLQGVQCE